MSSSVPTLTDWGGNFFLFLHLTPLRLHRHFTSPFTVLVLIQAINASTYKLKIHHYAISLCPSRTTMTRCLVVSVGALLPLPFDLAIFAPSHYPSLSLTSNHGALSGCLGGSIVAPPFRLGDIHSVSVRHSSLVKSPSLPDHDLKAGGLGAVLRSSHSAVAL